MLFKSYLKSSKKHISFCVNKSQNHTNRFGKASHFVLAIVNDFNTDSNAWIQHIMESFERMRNRIENMALANRPLLDGERYLTDKEVSILLRLSRRTLQDYRNEGIISYYQLGGKILYRESDIEKMLQENYKQAYKTR